MVDSACLESTYGRKIIAGSPPQLRGPARGGKSRPKLMFYVYIIKNLETGRYYTGYSENLDKRLKEHNLGKTRSLRSGGKFVLVYEEQFESRNEAYRRERQIKSYKSGEAFKKLVKNWRGRIVD